jgi:hypothetical protein
VVSPAPAPSTPPAPEKFTFRSLSRDFLKDAGEIWSYPVHIQTRDILPIAGLAVLTGFLIGNDEAIHWVPILAYTTATGVALSRETENKHWLSDSLVGGVLGYVIGRMVVLNHRSRYHVLPTAGVDRGSLFFAVTFSSR